MSLKKTDKIIAVIGVLILIIAAIGVIFFVGNQQTTEEQPTPAAKVYTVTWEQHTEKMPLISGYAGRKVDYTKPINVIASKPGSVITKVTIAFIWKDDHVTILGKGKDTLKAVITPPTGSAKTHTSVGSATNKTGPLEFTTNDIPTEETITDAGSVSDVEKNITKEYAKMGNVSFNTKITVTPGEKFPLLFFLRPLVLLRYIQDKGNNFQIEVTYTYYNYSINEQPGTPPTDLPPDNNVPPMDWSILSNTGFH